MRVILSCPINNCVNCVNLSLIVIYFDTFDFGTRLRGCKLAGEEASQPTDGGRETYLGVSPKTGRRGRAQKSLLQFDFPAAYLSTNAKYSQYFHPVSAQLVRKQKKKRCISANREEGEKKDSFPVR